MVGEKADQNPAKQVNVMQAIKPRFLEEAGSRDAYFGAVGVRVGLNVCPQSQHQIAYDTCHAALNKLGIE